MGSINEEQLRTIRKKMNRGTSSLIVYGMGCDANKLAPFEIHPELSELFDDNIEVKRARWKTIIDKSSKSEKNSFIANYFQELEEAPVYANSHCYLLKTSIVNSISKNNLSRATVLELNGNLEEGLDEKGYIVDATPDNVNELQPLFPDKSYTKQRKAVSLIEDCYRTDLIQIALFIGTSGICPVVESLYNRALTNKSFIVVVNPDENCYLHDLADLSLKISADEFFKRMNVYYSQFSEVYNELKN